MVQFNKMKIVAQSVVVPKGNYVHLAYLSAAQSNDEAIAVMFVVVGIGAVVAYLLVKLLKKLF
jgi:hypothetical protein